MTRWEPHLDPDTEPGLVTEWSGSTYCLLAALSRGDTVEEMGVRMSDDMRSVSDIIPVIMTGSCDQGQCPETYRDGLHRGGGEPGAPGVVRPGVTISGVT